MAEALRSRTDRPAVTPAGVPAARETVLQARGLTVRAGERTILRDVELDVRRNEVFAILGPSGVGKSTLLR